MKRVIIDTDNGTGSVGGDIDDGLAIILALRLKELQVEAITAVTGNVESENAVKNTLNLLELLGEEDIPVAKGVEKPFFKDLGIFRDAQKRWSKIVEWREWTNKPSLQPCPLHAVDLIISKIMASPGEISLITIGPLTNIATAFIKEPRLSENVKEIVVMGGACTVPGNVTPVAEFNVWADPESAKLVFESGAPIVMVGLDVTTKVLMTSLHLSKMKSANTPIISFILQVAEPWIDLMKKEFGLNGCYLHDPLAIGITINPSLVRTEEVSVQVETKGEVTSGQTIVYRKRTLVPPPSVKRNVKASLDVDSNSFMELFMKRMME